MVSLPPIFPRLVLPLVALGLGAGCVIKPKVIEMPEAEDHESQGVIVVGLGEVNAIPDEATVVFGVKERNDVSELAMKAVEAKVVKVLEAIEQLGIPRSDVSTHQLTLYEQYEGGPRAYYEWQRDTSKTPPKKFYEGVYRVRVVVSDLSKVSELLGTVQKAGVNQISHIDFNVKDPEPVLEKARKLAVEHAMAQARSLANNAGQEVGEILSIATNWDVRSDNIGIPGGVAAGLSGGASESQRIPIRPGELTFTRKVRMRFILKASTAPSAIKKGATAGEP